MAAVQAAFPKGNRYVERRAEFGPLYDDQLFADLYPPAGRPVEVAPWRLALVVVMQYIEGLTDRQAADAVRRCMDGKYVLSLELTAAGFDFTLLHDFRVRLLAHEAGQRFLDTCLAACKARGWINARGTQRTDSTHVLAAIRTLHRLECVLEAMHWALHQLSDVAPAWGQQHIPPEWYLRYGLRSDQARLPTDASRREALARQIGADGYQLLDWGVTAESPSGLRDLPALEALHRIWVQQYSRCMAPGYEALRWRTGDEQPPSAVRIASPDDLEARYSRKRDTHWVGYKVHLTETCDADHPHLIMQGITTPATTPDRVMGPAIQQDLATRNRLPATHVLDSGYVDADLLVTAQTQHQIDVMGPPFGSYSRQRREGRGYDLQAFIIDWEAQQARCPPGHSSINWRPGVESSLSQGGRCFDRRRSRYLGLARTHLQQLLTATAMKMVRVMAWLWDMPRGERRRKPGHLAQLAPHPWSRQTGLC